MVIDVELTAEEKAVFEEIKAKQLLRIPGRKAPDFDWDIHWNKTRAAKQLVYKDLVNFSIYNDKDGYGYVFFDREGVAKGERW